MERNNKAYWIMKCFDREAGRNLYYVNVTHADAVEEHRELALDPATSDFSVFMVDQEFVYDVDGELFFNYDSWYDYLHFCENGF